MKFKDENGSVTTMDYIEITAIQAQVLDRGKNGPYAKTVFDVSDPQGNKMPGPLTTFESLTEDQFQKKEYLKYKIGDKLYGDVVGKITNSGGKEYLNFAYYPPKEKKETPYAQKDYKGMTSTMKFTLAKDILADMAGQHGVFDASNMNAAKDKYQGWLSWFEEILKI